MMKKMTAACLGIVLGSSLNAAEGISSKAFLGLEVEATKVDSSAQVYWNDFIQPPFETNSDFAGEYGFNIGVEEEEWRATFLYTYYNNDESDTEETMNKGSFLLDYFVWTTRESDYDLKPYIGAHVGYMGYELTADAGYGRDFNLADESGVFYGGQVGVAMTVSEVIGLDLSYKYSVTSFSDIPSDYVDANGNTLHFDSNLDSMGSIAFGIKYFY